MQNSKSKVKRIVPIQAMYGPSLVFHLDKVVINQPLFLMIAATVKSLGGSFSSDFWCILFETWYMLEHVPRYNKFTSEL